MVASTTFVYRRISSGLRTYSYITGAVYAEHVVAFYLNTLAKKPYYTDRRRQTDRQTQHCSISATRLKISKQISAVRIFDISD